jgi:hypothetical protein
VTLDFDLATSKLIETVKPMCPVCGWVVEHKKYVASFPRATFTWTEFLYGVRRFTLSSQGKPPYFY